MSFNELRARTPERNFKIVCEDEESKPLFMKFMSGVQTEEAEDAIHDAIENISFKFQKEYDIIDDIITCKAIPPIKGSFLRNGSIYLATKENIEQSMSRSRMYESPDRSMRKSAVSGARSGAKENNGVRGVAEYLSEKFEKAFLTDRSMVKLTDESIVRSHLTNVAQSQTKNTRNFVNNLATYDRQRLVRSKLEQIYTNSLLNVRKYRQESNNFKQINL